MAEPNDGVLTMPIKVGGREKGEVGMAIDDSYFEGRLKADRDRHSTNATSLEKVLEMQYVSSKEFRDATAGRIVLEAGSGRTRAETNSPNSTSAHQERQS